MSEKAPLLDTKAMPLGPKTSDYVKVVVWPLLLVLLGVAFFAFALLYRPVSDITVYSVMALITMLLPVIPFLSALNLLRAGTKKAGNAHFWILVCVCVIVSCLVLVNDRILSTGHSEEFDSFFHDHSFHTKLGYTEFITDISLATLVVTVILGVLGATATNSFIAKLDLPPLPINA